MNEPSSFYQTEAQRLFQEGYTKQTEGDVSGAIQLYRQSLELFPTAEAHTFLGWALSFQGKFEDAIEECKKAIQKDPDYGNPYNDIGSYLIEKGRYDEALPWLEKATKALRYENYCYPYSNLGRLWEAKGKWDLAIENYDHSLRENSEYKLARKARSRIRAMMN